MKKYYDVPTQVRFMDDEGNPTMGIAYGDEIICASCGGIFEVSETEILENLKWVDFSEYIE